MAQSLETLMRQGAGEGAAVDLGDGIFMSPGCANSYLLTTPDGDVMINTGLPNEVPLIKARFERASQGPLRYIVFTQGHPDHVGGWSQFDSPGVKTIAQANHADVREYWAGLNPFYARRMMKIFGAMTGRTEVPKLPPEPLVTETFVDAHVIELGGRRIELLAAPGGEALDGLLVWLPASRTVFVGNLMGPFFGHVPNLYTIRGDKVRSAMAFMRSIERVMALEPETLINGHEAFRGAAEIRRTLTKIYDAIRHLRDKTIEGMNVGKDLWTLMDEVRLPPELALPQAHGKVAWIVRAIWEEHVGWFQFASTTELYNVPASAVWSDLLELAGSAAVVQRAEAHVGGGRPLHALHLTDVVLSQSPRDAAALRVKRQALQQLLERSGGETFSEVHWLKAEIAQASALLGEV